MDAMRICGGLWLVFVVVWLTWALRAKPVKRRESAASRLSYTILTLAGAYTMFASSDPRWLQSPIFPAIRWLQTPIVPAGPGLQFLAILITAMGIGVAIWARMYLGGNWSSSVTIKVGHQLVRTGPYRWVRHPIYSGLILGLLGTALAQCRLGGFLSVVLFYVGFKIKSRIEERTMMSTFGAEYDEYSRSIGAIVPKLRFR
jgi:protein-S-isoprenylcysteine O-methyltransferase Ste14